MRLRKNVLPIPTEYQEQKIVVQWLRAYKLLFAAIPNAAKRSPQTAMMLSASGMEAGAPDLIVFSPPNLIPEARGVAIEMKRVKGSKLNDPNQLRWHESLRGIGWHVIVAKGASDAIRQLENIGYAL